MLTCGYSALRNMTSFTGDYVLVWDTHHRKSDNGGDYSTQNFNVI